MTITAEEAEALKFEFQQLVRQKNHLNGDTTKWTAGKEKHLLAVVKLLRQYEMQIGDNYFTLRRNNPVKVTPPVMIQRRRRKPSPQMELIP